MSRALDLQTREFGVFRLRDFWALGVMLALIVACWRLLLGESATESATALQLAEVNQGNVARAVASHTSQVVEKIRVFGTLLVENARDGDSNAGDTVRRALAQDTSFLRLMLLDGDGSLLYSTGRQPEAWLLAAARDQARDRGGERETDVVALPVPATEHTGGSRQPFVYYPTPAEHAAQRHVVALLDMASFPNSFGDMDLGYSGEIMLVDRSGQVLLRLRQRAVSADASISASERYLTAFSATGSAAGSTLEADASGDMRFYAYQRVANSQLAVFVSRSKSDILSAAREHERQRGHWLLLLSVVGLGLATSRLLTIRRQYRLANDLSAAQGNNAQLQKQVETERRSVYQMATYDKLTGLPNRMLFADLSARHVARAKRTNTRFAVMFVDLDRFKPINDTYGHTVGDRVLAEVARRLQDCVREVDVVSRYGGDEFVALLSDLRSQQNVTAVAEKIIDSVSQPIRGLAERDLVVTPSIGIAFYPDDAQLIDELIRQADTAMYVAKAKGRATFAYSDAELNRRMALINEIVVALPSALAAGEIEVHYQPKVRLDDFGICGLEALARWTHAKLGVISPADFIPAAEKSDLIVELGAHVIEETCRQLAFWRSANVPLVPVAVNVSWRQLLEEGFCEYVMQTLQQFELSPQWLELEITETGLVQAEGMLLATLHKLRASGLLLAIDDFGTGYSGLSKLREIPARYVKIDRSFIQDIRNDTHDAAIVSNTISLSHSLGLVAIAEGVETAKQVAHLRAAGCDQAQGYFFSRPSSATDVTTLLRDGCIPVYLDN